LPSLFSRHILAAMCRLFVSFLLICFLAESLVAQQPSTRAGKAIAITHVTVIDPKRASVKHDITVVIRGDRIVTVRRSHRFEALRGATTFDAAGKFLISRSLGHARSHRHG
jgi:hypothetical protein